MNQKMLPIEDVENLASTTECTGLTPAGVQSEEEGETYAELYAIHQQKPAWEDGELGMSREALKKADKKGEPV